MDDKGFAFEHRKNKPNTNLNNDNINEREFSKGGGGDNFSRYGYVKSQVYSKQCYSDPQNPGKLICKEINNSTGYNPFDPNDNKSVNKIYLNEN